MRTYIEQLNGFPNNFWGWGGEDDDMSNRLRQKKLYISRYPANIASKLMCQIVCCILILAPKFELWAWLSSTGGVADMTVGVAGMTVAVAVCAAGDWRFSNSLLNVSCPISCIESPFEPKGKNMFIQCL